MEEQIEIEWAFVVLSDELRVAYVVTFGPRVVETEGEEVVE